MTARWIRPLDARRGVPTAVIAALLLLLAALTPSPASAVPATGQATIKPQPGKAKTDLFAQGASLRGNGKAKGGAIVLKVTDLSFGKVTTAKVGGTIVFARGKRRVTVRDIGLNVTARQIAVTGKVGEGKRTLFRAQGKSESVANTVALRKAPLALTAKGAKALAPRLGLDAISPGHLGTLNLNAVQQDLPKEEQPVQPKSEQPQPEKETKGDAYPFAAQCPVASGTGGPIFGDPPGDAPAPAALPTFGAGVSQDVVGTTIDWGFLGAFRGYVVNNGGSVQGLDGASASAEGSGMADADAYVAYPVTEGTFEAGSKADHADDKLVAAAGGTALICYSDHFFAYAIANPTIVVDGANSRLVADVGANRFGVWYPFQRADLATLDIAAANRVVSNGGNNVAWEDIPVTLTEPGETVLGSLYTAGTELDKITVSTTLERPIMTECGIASDTATPPTVDFTLDPLPTLVDPVVRTGKNLGTINWGFRRATRNSVSKGGTFLPFNGASEAFPGNMGGNAGAPPAGGDGKFFRFPISTYAYEVGTADPSDDRLIATSDASYGFCKPSTPEGNYGVVIAKPTLIIDGDDSRLVANAYSFSGPFGASPAKGWVGGRVELVDLDTSSISATSAFGTVRWGDINPDFAPMTSGIPVQGALKTEVLSLANLSKAATGSNWDPVAAQIVLP